MSEKMGEIKSSEFIIDEVKNKLRISSLSKLSEIIGISRSTLNHQYKKGLTVSTINQILIHFPELNPAFLLSGQGDVLLADNETSTYNFIAQSSTQNADFAEELKMKKKFYQLEIQALQTKINGIEMILSQHKQLA